MIRLPLFVVYVLVVTPVGLVWRLVNDPLQRRWDSRADSYWAWPAVRA